MPKETIHAVDPIEIDWDRDNGVDINGDDAYVGEIATSSELVVEVGWAKFRQDLDGPSHVSVVTYDRSRQALLGTSDDYEAGRLVPVAELDREGINRLIRTLRKARDQAFGADA